MSVWVRIFGKPANYYSLGKQSPLTIVFSLLHSLPMLHTLWESQEKLFIVKLAGESFRFGIFLKFSSLQFCHILFQWQISSIEIYLSLLLQAFPNSSNWLGERSLRRGSFDQLNQNWRPKFAKSMRVKQKWNGNNDYS